MPLEMGMRVREGGRREVRMSKREEQDKRDWRKNRNSSITHLITMTVNNKLHKRKQTETKMNPSSILPSPHDYSSVEQHEHERKP
jgi:hypothetical protein